MIGHKDCLGDHVLRASATEPERVPGVVDRDIGFGDNDVDEAGWAFGQQVGDCPDQ